MPYRRIFFEKGQPFHILSRAVEGRDVFGREEDCYRFIFRLQAANLGSPARNISRGQIIKAGQMLLNGQDIPQLIIKEHPPLVHLIDFSLVVNHYHFYLVANIENSVPLFMNRLNGGFAKYFNFKHKRKGTLFSSRYQAILIKDDLQSDAVSRYVSIINPLDVFQPGWRKKGLNDEKEALKFLKIYQFSSFPDRIEERNCKILAPRETLEKYGFPAVNYKKDYMEFVKEFLRERSTKLPFLLE